MSRMSLSRTGSASYRDYLGSKQWGFRRIRWFRDCRAAGYEPACQVCALTLEQAGSLDLHHTCYDGVWWDQEAQAWVAREADEDLMPMCRGDHQRLHQLMDRRGDYFGWDRHRASIKITAVLRRQFLALSHAQQQTHLTRGLSEARARTDRPPAGTKEYSA